MTAQDAVLWEKLIFRVMRFSVSVGAACMNNHAFPGHACGTEHFSSRSMYFSRLTEYFKNRQIFSEFRRLMLFVLVCMFCAAITD